MKDLNKALIELKDMLSDAMITQIDLDLKIKLVCKLNEALSLGDVVKQSEQLADDPRTDFEKGYTKGWCEGFNSGKQDKS